MTQKNKKHGFTLIELLVVIAIIAILATILLPSLNRAKMLVRITKAHVELRGITTALTLFRHEHEKLPPTRFSCSSKTAYELPIELMSYLPQGKKNGVDIVKMRDPFGLQEGYKYRAVGDAIQNESPVENNLATLWVPDGFPRHCGDEGKYYDDPDTSPVRYAVWSIGPDLNSPKFDVPGRLPVPDKYWLQDASDTGVIVHMEDLQGLIHISP